MMEDAALRGQIYDEIVRLGKAPSIGELAQTMGVPASEIQNALRRMHGAHMLVLQPNGELLMANPFSAVPTPFLTESDGRSWFGNCIWDALGDPGSARSERAHDHVVRR